MASSSGDKMLKALGIRLQRNDSKSKWKLATVEKECSINTIKDVPVNNTESDIIFTESVFNADVADKKNSSSLPNVIVDYPNQSECHIISIEESAGKYDKFEIPTTLNATEVTVSGTHNSSSSDDSSSDASSTSSKSSGVDFSSDDSTRDPNYKKSSSSSDSGSEIGTNLVAGDVEEAAIIEDENHIEFVEIVEQGCKIKTRKRKAQPSTWTKNRTKHLRNAGKSYKTYNKKVEVPPRIIKPPCNSDNCKQKCTSKFTEEERLILFKSYWAMADIIKQRNYIVTLMEDVNASKLGGRVKNNAFYFLKEGTKIRVCKVFFISTLGITNRCTRTIISKKQEGSLGDDLRGRHKKQPQVPEDIKNGIRNHISSIPTIESHYVRAHSQKLYIAGGKTIAQLYRDYREDCQKNNIAKFSMYRDIFNHEFNIAFFTPKKDQCQICVSFQNSSDEEKPKTEEKYAKHQEQKTLSREEKLRDKAMISPDYQVACFDLQAALPTPNGEVSSFYYRSKFSTYNFTVCNLDKKGLGNVYCFMWHEGEGKRGATEIGTCLLNFLKEAAEKADSDNLNIVFYSDNCAGQQKNKFVLAAFLCAVTNYKIKSITHKFLVTGHTQNEGDNVHSLIEKNIKRALKSGRIYIPAQYVTLLQTAKKSGTPFKVIQYAHEDFLDLKKLTEREVANRTSNSEGAAFKYSDVCILKVEKDNPSRFFYKTSFKEVDFKSVNLFKEKRTRNPKNVLSSFEGIEIDKAYQNRIPISKKKYDDLLG